jgi:hypothetical protein
MLFVIALSLLAGITVFIVCVFYSFKVNWIKRLLALLFWVGAGIAVTLFTIVFIVICTIYLEDTPKNRKPETEIIALDKFKTFSGKRNDRYYYTVLIKRPPKDTDSLKTLMVRYFYEKSQYISTVDSGSYLGDVYFWKYTGKTAYFINNDEARSDFSTDYLNKYRNTRIGYISARNRCENDPAKYEDVLYMYDNNGKDIRRERGLYSECGAL